ncbi:MAG: ABC transporter substrate-binding protein [Deltaproteobacteria bacterium]|nr:ABC transporter substrate-binding protein [Deltaproteobacteria bacterium]
MNLTRSKPGILIVIAALCGIAFSFSQAPAQQKQPIHITYSENMYATIAVVAIEKGYLAAQGLDVKHASEGTATEVLEAMVGGSTDFGIASPSRIEVMARKKLPVKAIALNAYGFTGSVVVPRRDQTTKAMADLKGKAIAVQLGTGTYGVWARYLKHVGLSAKDFTIKNTSNPLIPAAMESGSVDGAVTWEPSPTRMVRKGIGRVILGPDDLAKPINSPYPFFLIAPSRLIEQKPDLVQKVVNAWAQSVKYIQENPDDVARIMQESMKRMRGITLDINDVKREAYLTKYDRLRITDTDIKDTEELARVLVEEGRIKAVPAIRSVIENRFAEKASAR